MGTSLQGSHGDLKENFYRLKTRQDVASLLEISDYQLRYHLYISSKPAYITFEIPKKSGGSRIIHTPVTSLKTIQRKLNQVLRCVYQPKASTHGFAVGKSIITNASQHLRQRYVFNLDIKDFFPSINFGRVRGLCMAAPYSCTEEVATVLAQICCYENQLPQGAPTSPIISNMICAGMDSQLQRLAKKYQCIYTRYADDITFSTSKPRFPPQLAYFSENMEKMVIGNELEKIFEKNGFSINESKTRLKTRYKRQEVTGITVNEKINIKRKYIRQVRAMLHAWQKHGLENAEAEFRKKFDKKQTFHKHQPSFKYIVRGKIEFIGRVRGKNDSIYLKFLHKLNKLAPELVNADDLNISYSDPPSKNKSAQIHTEGKTDVKHLKAALRYFENKGDLFDFNIDFSDSQDEKRQGSAELLSMCKQICKIERTQPFIAIFDRDESKILKEVHDDTKGFKDWGNGVYSFALPIPSHRSNEKEICIELYYKDYEIQREDCNKRRLFLSNEFKSKSGRHSTLEDLISPNVARGSNEQLKIIDDKVFDKEERNVALSKADFANYILQGEQGFHDFDFEEFRQVFIIIDNILKSHIENTSI